MQQRILAFGTLIDISIATSQQKRSLAEQTIDDIRRLLKSRHHQWHAWQAGDLSSLNKTLSKQPTPIKNEDLIKLIALSKHYYQSSNGLFNPAIGKLIQAWGFHGNAKTNDPLIANIKDNMPTMDDVILHKNTIRRQNPYVQLDFGGIAKALAIIQIKALLHKNQFNDYLINIGGDISSKGTKHSKNWVAGVQNPFKQGAIATYVLDRETNLFTSGSYQRFRQQKNQRLHHIIDPRTGEPSKASVAVTINHKNPVTADVAATTLMIAHKDEWLTLAQQMHVEDFMIITPDKQIWLSRSFFNKLTFNTALKINIIGE